MALDGRHAGSSAVLFGMVVVLVGVLLTLQTNHLLSPDALRRFWPLIIVAVGVALVLRGIFGATGDGSRQFHWAPLVIMLIVGSVVVQGGRTWSANTTESADRVTVFSIMGQSHAVSQSPAFRGAEVSSFMGGAQLDLRQATIPPGTDAAIDVDVLMGGAVLRVPESWIVEIGTTTIFGGVRDERPKTPRASPAATPAEAAAPETTETARPRLKVRGAIVMGGLVIRK